MTSEDILAFFESANITADDFMSYAESLWLDEYLTEDDIMAIYVLLDEYAIDTSNLTDFDLYNMTYSDVIDFFWDYNIDIDAIMMSADDMSDFLDAADIADIEAFANDLGIDLSSLDLYNMTGDELLAFFAE